MCVRIQSNNNVSSLLLECKMVRLLLKTFDSFCKVKQYLSYDPAILLLGIYLSEMKLCSHKTLYINFHNNMINNYKKLEADKMHFNKSVDKQTGAFIEWNST